MLLQLRVMIVVLLLLLLFFISGYCYGMNQSISTTKIVSNVTSKQLSSNHNTHKNKQQQHFHHHHPQINNQNDDNGALLKLLKLPEISLPSTSSSSSSMNRRRRHDHDDETFQGITIRSREHQKIPSFHNDNTSNHYYYYHQNSRSLLLNNCIYNENDLRNALSNIPCCLLYPTRIDICASYMIINRPILFKEKNLQFVCNLAMTVGNKCTIDGMGSSRHFTIYDATISFDNIILLDGASDLRFTHDGTISGGAMMIQNSTVQITDCSMVGNVAYGDGGAIYAMNSILVMTNSNFSNNFAYSDGGVIHASYTTMNFTSCHIDSNNALTSGGVIYSDRCQVSFTYGTITNNYAYTDAGVIYALGYSSITFLASTIQGNGCGVSGGVIRPFYSNIIIIDSIMTNNKASYGGVISSENTTIMMMNCTMIANTAEGSPFDGSAGGVLYVAWSSTLHMTDCFIYNNQAQFAGALIGTENTQIVFMRCTMTGNHADYNAGAIYIDTNSNMQMTDCNISYNTATNCGGGMMIRNSSISLTNVVFNNNMAEQGTIRTHDSLFTLKNISFLSSNPLSAPCNVFVSISFLEHDIPGSIFDPSYRESCIDIPTSSISNTDRRLLTTKLPTIQAHNQQQKHSTVFDQLPVVMKNNNTDSKIQVLITNTSSETYLSIPDDKSRQQRMMATTCVSSSDALQNAVRSANPRSGTPTTISVCTPKISLGSRARRLQDDRNRSFVTNLLDGIDISNKNIILVCKRRRNGRCTLDAGGDMRHFYGSNAKLQFHKIRFRNGYHTGAGGALMIDNSTVSLTSCSFHNNTATNGAGAVWMNQTNLIVGGRETIVNQTGGLGAPIEIYNSNGTFHNVTITNNNASLGDSLLLFNSSVGVENPLFGNTSDCNLYVSVDPFNATRNGTCVSVS